MALLSVIRRWYHREGLSVREVSRRTQLSRNTIRKYVSSGEVEPRYRRRQGANNLEPSAETLSSWRKRERDRGRKERRTVKALYRDLVMFPTLFRARFSNLNRAEEVAISQIICREGTASRHDSIEPHCCARVMR